MRVAWLIVGVVLWAPGWAAGQGLDQGDHRQHYPNISGEVVFENERVLVQRFVLQPGEWEGIHTHSGNQLSVGLSDGESTIRSGDDETVLIGRVGSVGWQRAVTLDERHESGATGHRPVEWLWLNLKPGDPAGAPEIVDHRHHYPNIPGEVVFENDRILVQHYVMQPGEWEGIHSHSGNQLFVMLTEGESTVRYGARERVAPSFVGQVAWQPAVDISEEHESGNTGDAPLAWLWVNFKY